MTETFDYFAVHETVKIKLLNSWTNKQHNGYWMAVLNTIIQKLYLCFSTKTCKVLLNWPQRKGEKYDAVDKECLDPIIISYKFTMCVLTIV